jgi:hypothetical protein
VREVDPDYIRPSCEQLGEYFGIVSRGT